jgi:hypothetical protein
MIRVRRLEQALSDHGKPRDEYRRRKRQHLAQQVRLKGRLNGGAACDVRPQPALPHSAGEEP